MPVQPHLHPAAAHGQRLLQVPYPFPRLSTSIMAVRQPGSCYAASVILRVIGVGALKLTLTVCCAENGSGLYVPEMQAHYLSGGRSQSLGAETPAGGGRWLSAGARRRRIFTEEMLLQVARCTSVGSGRIPL